MATAPDILTVSQLMAVRRLDATGIECLVVDDDRLTFAEIDARSARVARQLLDAGVCFGARVGMLLGNTPGFVIAWTAITRIGAVAVPISTLSTPSEIRRIATHANLHALVFAPEYLQHSLLERVRAAFDLDDSIGPPLRSSIAPCLRHLWMWGDPSFDAPPAWANLLGEPEVQTQSDSELLAGVERSVSAADAASIIYTSGSTAEPKGVIHTHGSMLRAGHKCRETYDLRPGDRAFTQMPFFWVGGLTVNLLASMLAASTLTTCSSSRAADVLEFLERERATNVMAWPHLARTIAADPTFPSRDLTSVRVGSLWEALPVDRRPSNPRLLNTALGMTETAGPHTIASMVELPEHRRGSFGPPQPGMEHRVVDPASGDPVPDGEIGELHVRGDTLTVGLVQRERHETFDQDGWYATGDLVSMQAGHLHFHGRLDDMIKSAGANVSPREVEECLLDLPDVVAATVTSVPDSDRGAVVGAAVVTADRSRTADELRDAVAQELSSYKVPRVIVVLHPDDVPLSSSGKVDRRKILETLRNSAPVG